MKRKFLLWAASLCVMALVITSACTKAPSDATVTSDIQSRLAADSGLQNKQISVQAANGTVTLSGNVDDDTQREAAAKYAASEPGVRQVVNNLQVSPMSAAASAPAPAAQEPAPAPQSKPEPSHKKHMRSQAIEDQPQNQAQQSAPDQQNAQPAPPQQVATQAPPPPAPPPPPPEPQKVTVPSGTALPVRLVDPIDSATAQTGDTFRASLDSPISVDGAVVVPAHYDVQGHIVNAQSAGKFQGRALLELQLDKIKVGDRWYNIETDHFKQETGSRGKNTAEKVGAGAVAGAILGGIFGGGKGAAIGTVAGAGAGGGVQAAGKKPDIKLASERLLTFSLQSPVTLVPTTKPAREGQKLDAGTQP
jgi:BON domain